MGTTIHIDDDVYASVKTLAKTKGVPPEALIGQLLRRTLPIQKPTFGSENNLPIFQVKRDAKTIPGDRASQLLENE